MMKALNFIFAALTLLLGLTSCLQSKLVSGDQSEDPGYTYNEETNTYTVYTVNGLLAWNKAVQDDLTLNCTLAADIDLTGINYEWLLVGSNDDQYTGTFEGGGYTITGLIIDQGEANYVGLIGCLSSEGKVQNLTLKDMDIAGSSRVGGLVGLNYGTVTTCSSSGNVSGSSYVGGVVGYNSRGTVSYCTVSISVSGSTSVGGVAGGNFSGTVSSCTASGSVSGGSRVGGIVGENSQGTVSYCTTSCSVSGSTYVNDVVGSSWGGSVIS